MQLKPFKRGDIWHYRGTVNGQRLRGSTKLADKTKALRKIAEIENRAWKSHLDGPHATLTFAQAAILYRQANKPTRFLEKIEDYWRDKLVKDITGGAIRQSAITLYPDVSGATRNRQVIVPTQAIINNAAKMELCQPRKVERFKEERKEREPVTWEWVSAFMEHSSPHLGALCCFMFLTGARITEALRVEWRDTDLGTGRALIRSTKIGIERRAHLPPVLVAAIANILSNRNPDDRVFKYSSRDTAKDPWRKACKRAGIKSFSYHACRHGFATAMLHKGIDPITVAKLGGWKDSAHLFRTYGHAMTDDTLANLIADTPSTTPVSRKLAQN